MRPGTDCWAERSPRRPHPTKLPVDAGAHLRSGSERAGGEQAHRGPAPRPRESKHSPSIPAAWTPFVGKPGSSRNHHHSGMAVPRSSPFTGRVRVVRIAAQSPGRGGQHGFAHLDARGNKPVCALGDPGERLGWGSRAGDSTGTPGGRGHGPAHPQRVDGEHHPTPVAAPHPGAGGGPRSPWAAGVRGGSVTDGHPPAGHPPPRRRGRRCRPRCTP